MRVGLIQQDDGTAVQRQEGQKKQGLLEPAAC